jgi:hypothetical protein
MPSTVVRHIEYDPQTERLTIHYTSGAVYAYFPVPEEVFLSFMQARSKGVFLNKYIKTAYAFERIEV